MKLTMIHINIGSLKNPSIQLDVTQAARKTIGNTSPVIIEQ